jgi:hypothetical protein
MLLPGSLVEVYHIYLSLFREIILFFQNEKNRENIQV